MGGSCCLFSLPYTGTFCGSRASDGFSLTSATPTTTGATTAAIVAFWPAPA